MSTFDDIVGHPTVVRILTLALSKPGHAYLFCGPVGVGKATIAARFASALLGTPSILNTHPDFIRLTKAEGAREIVVKQARELLARMHLTSAYGGYKVALIESAHRLNEEAANALLKAVEEPSGKTAYIFVTEQPDRLPATLRSRLIKIEFGPLKAEDRAKIARREESWCDVFDWQAIITPLLASSVGRKLQTIEKLTQAVESQPDPETAWQDALARLMQALDEHFRVQPEASVRLARGLSQAWRLVGSSISPRLALEYSLLSDEAKEGRLLPRALTPT